MKRPIALLAGLVLSACAPAVRGAPPRECPGTPIATVRNNWTRSVDVYAEIGHRSDWLLGEVQRGERREFTVPSGATRIMYRWRGPYAGPPPTSTDIAITYACQ